jgi:predicted GIY-YIG superfamily endonuclease
MNRPRGYWTKYEIHKLALHCKSRSEFRKRYRNAYHAAHRKGVMVEVCSHMSKITKYKKHSDGYWTKEAVHAAAKKYSSRAEFIAEMNSAYQKALKQNWLKEVCSHMKSAKHKSGFWTKERAFKKALMCKTRIEFIKKQKLAYSAAQRHGWLDDICKHMTRTIMPPNYWTKAIIQPIANNFETRAEFYRGHKNAYAAAHRNQWLDEVCLHMNRVGNMLTRCIYVLYSKTANKAYVGLTFNFKKRMASHFSGQNRSTQTLVENQDIKAVQLTDYLPVENAIELELNFFNEYKNLGFKMLNRASSIGGLGGKQSIWNIDAVAATASQYTRRVDFRDNDSTAYNVARQNGWLDKVCRHMNSERKPHGYWTKERVQSEAIKYKTKTEFRKNASAALSTARKKDWVDEVCKHMVSPPKYVKWSYQVVQEEATRYTTKKAFVANSNGAARAAYSNGWINDVCRHMHPPQHPRYWTFKKVKDEAKKYTTRTEFTNKSAGAASAAKKNGWMDKVCEHMVSGRAARTYWTFDKVKEEATKYSTKKEFKEKSSSASTTAQRNGWMIEVCSHMTALRKKKGYWNLETLKTEALKYNTRTDFCRKAKGAYSISHRNGWLDIVCNHMVPVNK